MRKWIVWGVAAVLWAGSLYYAYGFGALGGMFLPDQVRGPARSALSVITLFSWATDEPCAGDPLGCGYADTTGRTEVACPAGDDGAAERAVLFAFGQSNSGNAARDRYVPLHDVVNFNPLDGKCYRAEDPLLGAEGTGGSVWGRLADLLIRDGAYRGVTLVSVGVGGTSIDRWVPGGDLHARLEHAAAALARSGIQPTHVLWHQGETDVHAGMSGEEYAAKFESLAVALERLGIDAPVFPAVTSHCYFEEEDRTEFATAAADIRAAQESLPGRLANVRAGPDTDVIDGPQLRHDNCHFTHKGIDLHARLWQSALAAEET